MKIPAKKIITAIIFGAVMFNAGFSFAKNNDTTNENFIYFSEEHDHDREERKREFWEKFRESVKPREKPPSESNKPREVHPREVHPRESE